MLIPALCATALYLLWQLIGTLPCIALASLGTALYLVVRVARWRVRRANRRRHLDAYLRQVAAGHRPYSATKHVALQCQSITAHRSRRRK